MSSGPRSEPLDLDHGLPTTPDDVAALRKAASVARRVADEDYLSFLAATPPATYEELKRKPGPSGEPFRLP